MSPSSGGVVCSRPGDQGVEGGESDLLLTNCFMYFIPLFKGCTFLESQWFSKNSRARHLLDSVIPDVSLDFEIEQAVVLQHFASNNTLFFFNSPHPSFLQYHSVANLTRALVMTVACSWEVAAPPSH